MISKRTPPPPIIKYDHLNALPVIRMVNIFKLINHTYLYLALVEAVAEETLELLQPFPFSV